MKATFVRITPKAEKDLKRIPKFIADKLDAWIENVETDGIDETRRIPGYHDEPLKGDRKGERSIRLSRAYRAIYIEMMEKELRVITVLEVHKHDY